MKNKLKYFLTVGLITGSIILSFFIGKAHQQEKLSEETVSIQYHNNIVKHLEYSRAMYRATTYMLYQRHHGKEIDTTFAKFVDYHIWVPNEDDLEHYINWEITSPNETPFQLAWKLDSLAANYNESIAFMWMDEKHDSTWVYNSESYQHIMDGVNIYRTRMKK